MNKKIRQLAKTVFQNKVERGKEIARKIIKKQKNNDSDNLEDLLNISSNLANELRIRGFSSVRNISNASLNQLLKISELEEGRAKDLRERARDYLINKLKEMPGIGKSTAKELISRGIFSINDLNNLSVEELTEVDGIGENGAKKIKNFVEEKSISSLEELPGVGEETVPYLRENGFTAVGLIGNAEIVELSSVPNIGEKGAREMKEYAKENPDSRIDELPGVGEETEQELRKRGFTELHSIAEAGVEDLSKVPNIGKKGAKRIIKAVRDSLGGNIEDLNGISKEEALDLNKNGFHNIGQIANAELSELIEVDSFKEGKALELKESAKKIIREEGMTDVGVSSAMNGIVEGLESDRELSLVKELSNGNYSISDLEKLRDELKERSTQDFRPSGERAFNEAWAEFLQACLEVKKSE